MAKARKYGYTKPIKHYVNPVRWAPKINKPVNKGKKGNKV